MGRDHTDIFSEAPENPLGGFVVLGNVEEAIKALPEDEQRAYRECQQSVIDARRSAERIEGQIVIC